VFCGQFHQRSCRFDTGQLLEKVKGGLGIRVSEFKQLGVIVLNALKGRGHAAFDSAGSLRGGCTDFLVIVVRLRSTLFHSLAEIKSRFCSVIFRIVHVLILRAFLFKTWGRDALSVGLDVQNSGCCIFPITFKVNAGRKSTDLMPLSDHEDCP
jgi:hypothetical protein